MKAGFVFNNDIRELYYDEGTKVAVMNSGRDKGKIQADGQVTATCSKPSSFMTS